MTELDLRDFHDSLADTFRRYLFTLNFLPDSERELRDAFWTALQRKDVFERDPLLSVIPAYVRGQSTAFLLNRRSSPSLHGKLAKLSRAVFDVQRPLYTHQIQSLALAQSGKNVIVATGTGSGKTECFLLPVLNDALANSGDGVRAIVVYPLNALANDQLSRLRGLLIDIPEVTFGRYTGETPLDRTGLTDTERKEISEKNERFSREEIRSRPPHILLTNFAMLEYLLLRPRDSEIFRQRRLKYVILDEAHTYSGAQGIEVGLLMRRLAQAFPSEKLQFVLTSATLGEDKAKIAEFGQRLTGAEFSSDDVVLGEVHEPFSSVEPRRSAGDYLKVVPDDDRLRQWLLATDNLKELKALAEKSGLAIPADAAEETASGPFLAKWLRRNGELAALHRAASKKPITIEQACTQVWATVSNETRRLAEWLIALGSRATLTHDSPPLLPARYHLFFRGLRGAGVCLSPRCPDRRSHPATRWSSLVLEDRVSCPTCEAYIFPLLTCVHCGSPVLRVYEDGFGRWQSATPSVSRPAHLLSWKKDLVGDEQSASDNGDESSATEREVSLCLRCRAFSLGAKLADACCGDSDHVRLSLLHSDGDGLLKVCPTCGGQRGGFQSVLREVSTGEDAATAVLAEAMVRALPEEDVAKPAFGKRLLAFSDSRQRAAHFAPYLARTTAETQYMKPMVQAIAEATKSSSASFEKVAERFLKFAQGQPYVIVRRTNEDGDFTSEIKRPGQLYKDERDILKRECLISLLQHFTAPARARNTLPGLGIAYVSVDFNDEQVASLPGRLPELFASGNERGFSLLQSLLQVILRQKAVGLPDGILLTHIQSMGPKVVTVHHNQGDRVEGRLRFRWNPYLAKQKQRVVPRSSQAEIIARYLKKDKSRDDKVISEALDSIWEAFRDLEVLRQDYPSEFVLPFDRLLIDMKVRFFWCIKCGAPTVYDVCGECTIPGCGGRLYEMSAEESAARWRYHHWYYRLTQTEPLPLEVREHTAQLTNEAGRDYQRKFTAGMLNVLSSSTTFELGVDVGQLKSVFLRNMPPTPANYIQRAGRAGRRREGTAFSVTYARSFPHDQVHYHEPLDIVKGTVPVPRINLANERLAQRHINSLLLGRYLTDAHVSSAREQMTVEEFFLNPSAASPASKYASWLKSEWARLLQVASIVLRAPSTLDGSTALNRSVTMLKDVAVALAERISAYGSQAGELEKIVKSGSGRERRDALRNFESVTRLLEQLREERLIDHLASAHWLPSYAFPQDVVRLLVRQPSLTKRMRLERDAEYGISEYAPGSEVVVDGRLLVSRGLDLQNKELEVQHYRVCSRCNRVQVALTAKEISPACKSCGGPASGPRSMPRCFVIPRGFTTSIEDPALEVRLNRLKPPPNSEVFLIEGAAPGSFSPHAKVKGVAVGYRTDGTLFRANSGKQFKQFKICRVCGRGFDNNPRSHTKPWGAECPNRTLIAVDLVCTFETDTLQIRFEGTRPTPPKVDNADFWTSFQTAFIQAAADVLVVPARDIDGTYRSQHDTGLEGELVVYDRVPGGAGYVGRIVDELPMILEETCRRVRNCRNPQCDPLGSCYACLRTYTNQFQWERLHRNVVADWLEQVL